MALHGNARTAGRIFREYKMIIAVSIPVHEKPDVILDQISNVKKYIENVIIVLHISKVFYEKYEESTLDGNEGVFINPEHLATKWGDIVSTHISNFQYLCGVAQFDYFVMHSSNDMYIRSGIEDYISQFEAGFQIRKVFQKYSHWWPGDASFKDSQLDWIKQNCGQSMTVASQLEGSFYSFSLMKKIISVLQNVYDANDSKIHYTREEVYFSTVASSLIDWAKIGRPTTFSEVHRFDRKNWALREKTRKAYNIFFRFFIPRYAYDSFEALYNNILFKSRFYKITKKDVKCLRRHSAKTISKNRFLDDGSGSFELYDDENIFSVKRISRDYTDSVRKFIRKLGV